MGAVFELHDLTQDYGGRRVLHVNHLRIAEGECFVLLGPNGAGKSTLLRLLSFLEPPSAGELRYRDQPVAYPAPLAWRREVTAVFQHPAMLSRTVWENLTYGLRLRGRRPGPALDDLIQHLDLARMLDWPAHRLSRGEMQRVALGRALALSPRALLLDEPTANLDPYNITLVETMIQALRGERRMTLMVVTQHVFQARRLADRVGLLLGGELVEVGEAERFFEEPTDGRVSAFVRGEMIY
ncbi:MAG: ATP-binding cassette domain-containing protein [Chloroflexota bacterium]